MLAGIAKNCCIWQVNELEYHTSKFDIPEDEQINFMMHIAYIDIRDCGITGEFLWDLAHENLI